MKQDSSTQLVCISNGNLVKRALDGMTELEGLKNLIVFLNYRLSNPRQPISKSKMMAMTVQGKTNPIPNPILA
jgi:hypothetical protein